MFFDKKVWDDFEKEIEKWEKEGEIPIFSGHRLAAEVISNLIDEMKSFDDYNEEEAIEKVLESIKLHLTMIRDS